MVRALKNFNCTGLFKHENYLALIETCMKDAFLDQKEKEFLHHMLTKYKVNYLRWAHKTKWVKSQIAKRKQPLIPQLYIDFEKKPQAAYASIFTQPAANVNRLYTAS